MFRTREQRDNETELSGLNEHMRLDKGDREKKASESILDIGVKKAMIQVSVGADCICGERRIL
jgi:hypothetical protein